MPFLALVNCSSQGAFIIINIVCQFVRIIKETQITNRFVGYMQCFFFSFMFHLNNVCNKAKWAVGEDTAVWNRMLSLAW